MEITNILLGNFPTGVDIRKPRKNMRRSAIKALRIAKANRDKMAGHHGRYWKRTTNCWSPYLLNFHSRITMIIRRLEDFIDLYVNDTRYNWATPASRRRVSAILDTQRGHIQNLSGEYED